MYCKYCGNNIVDDAIFCSSCGKQINSNIKGQGIAPAVIAILWWSLIMMITWVVVYANHHDNFARTLPLFPIYLGGILIVYTIIYLKRRHNSTDNHSRLDKNEYTLKEFSKKYGKMQICRYRDYDGAMRCSKCTFTLTTEVRFDRTLGELSAQDISKNKNNLIIRFIKSESVFVLSAKDIDVIERMPPTTQSQE